MPIPVILDTDLGDDIDDAWALAMMLRSPELGVKLVAADYGNALARATLIAKLLDRAGRTDVPVAVGHVANDSMPCQCAWLDGYALDDYPGTVHRDGADAIVRTIMTSDEPITLVAIGPPTTIAIALEREPAIARRTNFVGMFGSIHSGHDDSEAAIAEWNVKCDLPASQSVLGAPWRSCTITPLDTCARARLTGDDYQHLLAHASPIMNDVLDLYRIWQTHTQRAFDPAIESSRLYDCVAVHLAYSHNWLDMQRLNIAVDDEGFTRIDDTTGKPMDVAVNWQDRAAFDRDLVRRLCD